MNPDLAKRMLKLSALGQAAVLLASRGYKVFRLAANSKIPMAGTHGCIDATTDIETIVAWWEETPNANIGIACGDIIVFDLDGPDIDWPTDPSQQDDLTYYPKAFTPGRGGTHIFAKQPTPGMWGNTAKKLHQMIDTRGAGGYVVACPSIVAGKTYMWLDDDGEQTDECPLPQLEWLPAPTDWMQEQLDGAENKSSLKARESSVKARELMRAIDYDAVNEELAKQQRRSSEDVAKTTPATPIDSSHVEAGNIIPQGVRDASLARMAGRMRAFGCTAKEIYALLCAVNRDRCQPPLPESDLKRIALSICRYEPDQLQTADAECLARQMGIELPQPATAKWDDLGGNKVDNPAPLRQPIVNGLLRRGEVMSIVAAPKTGKTWLVHDLLLALATGQSWFGFECEQSNVALIDNELDMCTIENRLANVAKSRDMTTLPNIMVRSVRCIATYIMHIHEMIKSCPVKPDVLALDAFYLFIPPKMSENDNAAIASLMAELKRIAVEYDCAVIIIHHTSKGSQASKYITDGGAGAGAITRAVDTHIYIRMHTERDVFVFEAVCRTFRQPAPMCIRWEYPRFHITDEYDPADLHNPNAKRTTLPQDERTQREPSIISPEQLVNDLVPSGEQVAEIDIQMKAEAAGLSRARLGQYLRYCLVHELLYTGKTEHGKVYSRTAIIDADTTKRDAIIADLEAGMSTAEAAEKYGVSQRYVQKIRKAETYGQ